MDNVDELVEWVFRVIVDNKFTENSDSLAAAKAILSHPDLALIDRTVEYPSRSLLMMGYLPAIPLAEALKEKENGT